MEDYGAMIRSTFEMGSVRDAEALFEAIIRNAFPTNTFRRLELIRFIRDQEYLEGRSWNHVFEIRKTTVKNQAAWDVRCRRVTSGKSPDKNVFLDYLTLMFVQYQDA